MSAGSECCGCCGHRIDGSGSSTSANLMNANLSGAELRFADLGGANLGSADATDASFVGANLTGTDLSNANFAGADLNGADLLFFVVWANTTCPDGTNSNDDDGDGFSCETTGRRVAATAEDDWPLVVSASRVS